MIFDASKAVALYKLACSDSANEEDFHLECSSLIEAIATSLSPEHRDDLIQEGHVKLMKLVRSGRFKADTGSMYSFLSSVLRNCMIDWLRSKKDFEPLPNDVQYSEILTFTNFHTAIDDSVLNSWAISRFPKLDSLVVSQAALYAADSIIEQVKGKRRAAIVTMSIMYPLSKSDLSMLYDSVRAFVHSDGDNIQDVLELLHNADDKLLSTYIPELSLLIGIRNAMKLVIGLSGIDIRL